MRHLVVLVLALMLSLPVLAQDVPPELEPITAANMDRLTLLYELHLGEGRLREVRFSPDETLIATLMENRDVIELWDATTGQHLDTLEGHPDTVVDFTFSPDGRLIVWGCDRTARVWNSKTGEELQVLEGHTDFVDNVAFNADGTLVASADDVNVRLWNVATGEELYIFTPLQSGQFILDLTFNPDGSLLAVLYTDGHVEIWDMETYGEYLLLEPIVGSEDPSPVNVAFSSDGRFVIVADVPESGYFWDISQTPPEVTRLPNLRYITVVNREEYVTLLPFLNNEDKVYIVNLLNGQESEVQEFIRRAELPETFGPDGTIYVTTSSAVVFWDISGPEATYSSGLNGAIFSPGGTYVAEWIDDISFFNNPDEVVIVVGGVPQSANI